MNNLYDECPLEFQKDTGEMFSLESEMSIKERCDRFLCLIKQACIIFLETEKSGTLRSLLSLIKEYIQASEFANKNEYLPSVYKVLGLVEDIANNAFDESTIVETIHRSYDDFMKLILSLQNERRATFSITYSMPRADENSDELLKPTLFTSSEIPPNNDEVTYKQLVALLRKIISSLEKDEEFKNEMYDGRRFRDENECSRKFASRIKIPIELQLPIFEIEEQKKCLDGTCDIIVKKIKSLESDVELVIPIEAKTNKHTKLWSAIGEQLVGKYMGSINPYGIYLVYWFGENVQQSPPTELCNKPQTHIELEKLLHMYTVPSSYTEQVTVLCINCV